MTHQIHSHDCDRDRQSERTISRRSILVYSGAMFITGLTGCSGTDNAGIGTDSPISPTPPADSVFESVGFEGPNLVVNLKSDHSVDHLNLIAPDGSTFRQTGVAEGATTVRLQILFKSGGSYTAGEHQLVAVIGDSSESMSLDLHPDLQIVDVEPEFSDDDQQSTGRLLVTVKNNGSGPTWVYNIGFKKAPYPNAPQVIDGVADTTFERPENPEDEFLSPEAERVFLKKCGVLIISDDDEVSCEGDEANLTVVAQTPHGDVEQPIRAHLSEGYNVEDPAAVQHPCKNVEIYLVDDGESNA